MIVFDCCVCGNVIEVTRHEAEKSLSAGAPILCPDCGSIFVLELNLIQAGNR